MNWTLPFNTKYPLSLGNDAFTLKLEENTPNHPLYRYSKNGVLNYEVFFADHLKYLKEILDDIKVDGRIKVTHDDEHASCGSDHLQNDPNKGPYYSMCKNCLVNVTQTKSGICLILTWNNGKVEKILTVDLIPVLPIKDTNLDHLFNSVGSTLTKVKCPNWKGYMKSFINKDKILCRTNDDETRNEAITAGMKLVNYGSDKSFIIRPGQRLDLTIFSSQILAISYAYIKCLKTIFKVDIDSYSIKKVLLLLHDKPDPKNEPMYFDHSDLYLSALQHPDLKEKFRHAVCYKPPEQAISNRIYNRRKEYDIFMTVYILGDGLTGKSALLSRFSANRFLQESRCNGLEHCIDVAPISR